MPPAAVQKKKIALAAPRAPPPRAREERVSFSIDILHYVVSFVDRLVNVLVKAND